MWVIVESVSPRISGLYNLQCDGGPVAFSELAQKDGPDSCPTPKSVSQPAYPVDRVVRRNLSTRVRLHECSTYAGWAAAALQIEYFAFHQEASQPREKPLRQRRARRRRTSPRFGGD